MIPHLRPPALAALLLGCAAAAQSASSSGSEGAGQDSATATKPEPAKAGAAADPDAAASGDALLERLLTERESREELDKLIKEARESGIGEQAILEARFLFHVDRREDAEIAGLLPEFLERNKSFDIGESEIFAVREDWLAVVEYVQAIAALGRGDKAGFKQHITEAFWLSPRQGAAFAPHIDRLRMEEAMARVTVDFSTTLRDFDGNPAPLSAALTGNEAVLLHFWSPWSHECEAAMPDFEALAGQLVRNGVGVVSILGEAGPEVIEDARSLIAGLDSDPAGRWLVDSPRTPLHQLLRIQSVPAMVLVDPAGRVRFNGHPSDPAFWNELQAISPGIERPRLDDQGH